MDNSKIDSKQILILSLLIGVLVIVVCVNYLIRPVYNEAVKYKDDTAEIEADLEEMKGQSTIFSITKVDFSNNQMMLKEKAGDLMKLKKRNDLGTQITDMALSKGLSVAHLKLGEIEEYKVVLPYESKKQEKDKDKNKDNDKEKDNDDNKELKKEKGPDSSLFPGAQVLYDEKEEKYSLEYKTGEYSCYIDCSVKGEYSQIQKFVSEIAKDPSLGIASIKISNEDSKSDDSIFTAEMTIKANMAGDIPDMSYQGADTDENS